MNEKARKQIGLFLAAVLVVALAAGCSTAKNNARTRWWQSFTARYNTYYNGSLAYIDGSLEKETGNKDNYTEIIPLYTVGNKDSKELGKSNFDRAILKAQKAIRLHSIKRRPEWNKSRRKTQRDIEWLNRREYNPFLWKAWMLMGRSQFHEGDFDAAASTFAYMSRLYETQPAIYARARAWLAKCYVENGFLYDAEDVIREIRRDSIPWRAQKEWDYTMADYYIHAGDYANAIPYLRKVIRHEMRRKQKAREWFLMGQLCKSLGRNKEAYQAFRHTVRLNPPYELEFNARIAQTEVLAQGQARKMIGKLKRMSRSDNNKDYLDQVYYAIGNIYLAQKDTLQAIANYERGNKKSTRSGIEKGVLLLRLGDLYWDLERYGDAQRCYGEAIGMLDKERPDYEQLSNRSKVLDELVPFTDAIHLQDSLQALAVMDEAKRNEAIDRVIEAVKKKEKEEQRLQAEQDAAQAQQNGQTDGNIGNNNNSKNTTQQRNTSATQQTKDWYFYNQMAVIQGKQQFQKLWGKRENVDNWQRSNKTVVAGENNDSGEITDEEREKMAVEQAHEDSIAKLKENAENDPHKREYYLKQIPFTAEAKQASNVIIMDALYNSGVIFKDKLDNLPLSEKALRRLTDNYPSYEHMDNVFYHLFLLYSRKGEPAVASQYVDSLKSRFPKSQWTVLLTDPNFVRNAREGVHLEDSLYAATYNAFKADRYNEVKTNVELSRQHFPLGANRDKFLFIGALGKLNDGDSQGCLADLDSLVSQFPNSQVATLAGMIINGVKAGKTLRDGKFDMEQMWSRRTEVQTQKGEAEQKKLSNERNTPFVFMLAYAADSVNENQLLYQLARYNFTNYLVRDFDIAIEDIEGLHRMTVTGFRNFDEVLLYARQLMSQPRLQRLMRKARPIIISTQNLPLLGTAYSYDDYATFYNRHFAPLKVSTFYLLTEPTEVVTAPEPESKKAEDEGLEPVDEGTIVAPEGTTVPPSGTTIEPEPTETDIDNFLNDTFVGNDEPTKRPTSTQEYIIPDEGNDPAATAKPSRSQPAAKPTEKQPMAEPVKPSTNSAKPAQSSVTKPTAVPASTTEDKPVESKEPAAPQSVDTTEPEDILPQSGTTVILDDDETPAPPPAVEQKRAKQKTTEAKKPVVNKSQNKAQKKAPVETKKEKPAPPKKELKTQEYDLEDEYYDLDGF